MSGRGVQLPPSYWRLERDPALGIALDGIPLAHLCERWGSPLHVIDGARLVRNASTFLGTPPGAQRPCEVFYSYKTNPVPGVLRRLHARGVGAEVTSDHELWLALHLGVPPERIVLNGTAKSAASMKEAVAREFALINLNGREEIDQLASIARELGKRPRVGIRVAPGEAWASQLGERSHNAVAAFALALRRSELDVVAVHGHRGPEITTPAQLQGFVASILRICERLRAELRFEPSILDLGGSLCCPTVAPLTPHQLRFNRAFGTDLPARDPASVLGIGDYLRGLVGQVGAHYRSRNRPVPRIFLEPGRSMTGNTQMLLTRVLQVKNGGGIDHAILDAGVNVAQPLQSEYHRIWRLRQNSTLAMRRYRLMGPISSPGDLLSYSWRLPEVSPGDVLAVMDTGAYFVSFSTSFSFHQPGIAVIENGAATLLRRAETSEDLVVRDL
jgi:diaminopimelate decarboxylase